MRLALLSIALLLATTSAVAAQQLSPAENNFLIKGFRFRSGETLTELRLHYRTLGSPRKDAQGHVVNAVLILHGTGGSGASLMQPAFAGELFKPGGVLDAAEYFLILPDGVGFGESSKPSDGLHARFPRYGYLDMVEAQYRLVTEGLHINHLRLVMGTSMGGMHTWLWGEQHPDFMDALMPLATLPTQISGRNRAWRRLIIDAIRNDPGWHNGDYTQQPASLRTGVEMLFLVSSNPVIRQQQMPTLAESDKFLDSSIADTMNNYDANDLLYQFESSNDYDPEPALEKIRAPLFAINSADDLIDPPELKILERAVTRVPRGRAIVLPLSPDTRGHQSHSVALLWEGYLKELLAISDH